MSPADEGKAKGGLARADALSPKQRKEIAQDAAQARWDKEKGVPRATHSGELVIGDRSISCYVIGKSDERILSTRGIMGSLGRTWRGRKYSGTKLPVFLEAKNLSPFITDDLEAVLEPVVFRTENGGMAEGYRAEILPAICDVYLAARRAGGVLTSAQIPIAETCEILQSVLSRTGVIALVDEATGFQYVRDRRALQEILDAYLNRELAAWARRFPEDFYREIFRLKNWEWKGMKVNRPQVVAHYTNDFVYDRIPPGLLNELKTRMPKTSSGRNKGNLHQLFADDVGHPALAQHLQAVTALMRASKTWNEFKRLVNSSFPRKGDNLELDLRDGD